MAEQKLSPDFKKQVDAFFSKTVKVFETDAEGTTPVRFQDRPFVKTLPGGQTVFVQNTFDTKDLSNFALSIDKPIEDGSIAQDTESSKFLSDMEKRFRKAKPDSTMMIIDPDIVRGRYATDESMPRHIVKNFAEYVQGRLQADGVQKDFPLSTDDYFQLADASITGNSPLSATMPKSTGGQYSIVISTQPDMPMHDMFTGIPGSLKRIEKEGVNKDHVRRMILYHELGHALDTRNRNEQGDTFLDTMYKRHRTENVADAFAVLQMARDDGNADVGKLVSDIRADNTVQGMAYILNQLDQMRGGAEDGLEELKPREGFAAQSFVASPELKAYMAQHADDRAPENKGAAKEAAEDQGGEKQPTIEDALQSIESSAMAMQILQVVGSIAAYNTSPTADATVKEVAKLQKSGKLNEMSDKDVHELSEKMVDKTAFSKDQFAQLCYGVLTGQNTPELQSIVERAEVAKGNFPEDKEAQMKAQMKAMGMPDPDEQPTQEDIVEAIKWRDDVREKIEKEGGTKDSVVKVVNSEKDEIRLAKDSKLSEVKTSLMNDEMLETAEAVAADARTLGSVRNQIDAIEVPKVELTGEKAVAAYVKNEMSALEAGEKVVNSAATRDPSTMSVEEHGKAVKGETTGFKKVLKAEKTAQSLAFAIRKDSKAWDIAQKSPLLAERIDQKAKQKHPEWMDKMQANIAAISKGTTENLAKMIAGNKKILAHATMGADDVKNTLGRSLSGKLGKHYESPEDRKEAKKKVISKKARSQKKVKKEEGNTPSSKDIQWNYLADKKGR